jgi:hypothetical protein
MSFASIPPLAPFTDTDGDGFSDFAEFIAGTNPTQSNSMLRLASPVPLANGTLRLEWLSAPGCAYLVEGSNNGQTWTPLSDWIPSNGSILTFTPTTTPGAPKPGGRSDACRAP